MNKHVEVLTHMAAWVILLLLPLNFLSHHDGFSMSQYLMICVSPMLLMVMFYTNYLWLTPVFFLTGRRRYYWLISISMIIALGIGCHYWMVYVHQLYYKDTIPYHDTAVDTLLFILRNIFNLTIAAGMATTIVLAKNWHRAEHARQEAEAARKDAELSSLRSQVNPHFLLNTLNNIYALTNFDTAKAQEAIIELSKLLRHLLYGSQQPTVPLREEVEFIDNYVKLMRLRLPQTVDIKLNVSCATIDAPIAPMLITSLVENAFKHGVSPTEPSFIHITITADERQRVCDITNSNHPKNESDKSGHGIGLHQVQQRLNLAYPGHYTWEKGVSADGKVYRSCITIDVSQDKDKKKKKEEE